MYVTAKKTYLRDRVAAVSNRTATVENGDKLLVLDHGRRFLKVQTEKGELGWINEKVVATQALFDQFAALTKEHEKDPIGRLGRGPRRCLYAHQLRGARRTRFYRLGEGEKLKLLKRATLPKPMPPGMQAVAQPAASADGKAASS